MDTEFLQHGIDYGIIGLLGFMSFVSLWFWIERLLFMRSLSIETYRTKEALEIDLTRHLSIISSFGANAPYIGLLGTVFGIILTFYIMGQTGTLDRITSYNVCYTKLLRGKQITPDSAKKIVMNRILLQNHIIIYALVNIFLFVVNYLNDVDYWWFMGVKKDGGNRDTQAHGGGF